MFRAEDIDRVPHFEARANEFVKKIETLIPRFPNMVIVPRNKTLGDLSAAPGTIKWMASQFPEFVDAERARDHETEIESSYQNLVMISIGSEIKQVLYDFVLEADVIASQLGGRKRAPEPFKDHGPSTGVTLRYDGEILYEFD